MSSVAPVVVTVSASTTQKQVFGLSPGTLYNVVVKVFRFYSVECLDTGIGRTVPDMSQIISSQAISSTAIALEWDSVSSVDQYFILVNSSITNERYNLSFTNTSAIIQNLQPNTLYDCYVYTSNLAGLGARSRVRTVTTLVQPPAVVTVEPLSSQVVRITWQPVEKVLLYKIMVAYANDLPSVTSVLADYSCVSASAVVSWGTVYGTDSYRATAVDQNGRTISCTSTGTTCLLANLDCGRDYMVWVSAIAKNCESTSSISAFFQTVPCSPANLSVFRECSSNVIIFSWAPTNNTFFYRARMEDNAGGSQDCLTTETSCFFTNTVCGRNYSFNVYGINGDCNGPFSPTVSIQTAPCKPSNLITVSDCETDILTSSWDTVDGVTQYIVEGRGNRENTSHENYYSCISDTNSCAIPGVACGESLTLKITAFNDDCYSDMVLGQQTNTAPCVPENLLPITDCSSDSIILTWNMANGALFYIASVTDSSGGMYTCSTMELNCQITGLRCGTTYNATVMSSSYKCNSSLSNIITVETAPCPPSQVEATLDCDENRVLVSWLSSSFPGSYTASMVDQSEGLLNCSTLNSSCWVPSLKCGQVYVVSVTYHNNMCHSRPSSPIQINSMPCVPTNMTVAKTCSNHTTVAWQASLGAQTYSVIAMSSKGHQTTCSSNTTTCSLTDLHCGQVYNVSVVAINDACSSLQSQSATLQTGPCAPFNIRSVIECITNALTLSWDSSPTSVSYTGKAVGSDGHMVWCNSTSAVCQFTGLNCGQDYAISLTASDGVCGSTESEIYTQPTAPCAPASVSKFLHCDTNMLSVTWALSPMALSYSVLVKPINGLVRGCSSPGTSCNVSGLQCGLSYTLTVMAANKVCTGPESPSQIIQTAPCTPASVYASVACVSNTVQASWAQVASALSYTSVLTGPSSSTRTCSTSALSCNFSGLDCAQTYTLHVFASNDNCNSTTTTEVIVTTGV
ncbi:fibronectin type III domain-containing protein 7-like [Neoarius graeffei]|uniref:fibronectin type III domain-containing protein 7-like n=1 Tax=Neoarius graeffei TaxID=443677 RepID=UPI00298CD5FD|nr:fibronectin type III domain-containing protein 7-like [Neoarius graeffei]